MSRFKVEYSIGGVRHELYVATIYEENPRLRPAWLWGLLGVPAWKEVEWGVSEKSYEEAEARAFRDLAKPDMLPPPTAKYLDSLDVGGEA